MSEPASITREEMVAFVGMLIYMGIARLPQIELYWSTKHDLIRQNISDVMPRIRFEQILAYLHLSDCGCETGYNLGIWVSQLA